MEIERNFLSPVSGSDPGDGDFQRRKNQEAFGAAVEETKGSGTFRLVEWASITYEAFESEYNRWSVQGNEEKSAKEFVEEVLNQFEDDGQLYGVAREQMERWANIIDRKGAAA